MDWRGTHVTWLGHGTFHFRAPNGKSILLDPWLQNNPACPDDMKHPPATDVMLITHGHLTILAMPFRQRRSCIQSESSADSSCVHGLARKALKILLP